VINDEEIAAAIRLTLEATPKGAAFGPEFHGVGY